MDLLLATRNPGKLHEIELLLAGTGIRVRSVSEFSHIPEIEEDGDTFEANARKKAQTVADLSGLPTLADDSGLQVKELGGLPGVRSSRYAGESASDADNTRKLLAAMEHIPFPRRRAAFCCVMALCRPRGECHLFHGRLEGIILEKQRGSGGFGYDPVFLVAEYGKTLAELGTDIKNRISHRGQALRQVVDFLRCLPPATFAVK